MKPLKHLRLLLLFDYYYLTFFLMLALPTITATAPDLSMNLTCEGFVIQNPTALGRRDPAIRLVFLIAYKV